MSDLKRGPKLSRREFIKAQAVAAAAAAAGLPITAVATELKTAAQATELRWSKAPCRFCGTVLQTERVRPGPPLGAEPLDVRLF